MNHFTAGEVEGSVPARFARVAAARAGALAIVTEGERLTYAQLDRRSDTLAAAVARATGRAFVRGFFASTSRSAQRS